MCAAKTDLSRRLLVGGAAAAAAGAVGWQFLPGGGGPDRVDASAPPETSRIRLIRDRQFPVLCYAPQYVARQFLEMEGFTDIEYVSLGEEGSYGSALIDGTADLSAALAVDWVIPIAREEPIVVLSGLHAGCVEVFANNDIASIEDLKGRRVAIHGFGSPERYLLASMLAYIGLDPERDVTWVLAHPNDWAGMLQSGRIDAMASFPPLNYMLHDQKIGHVILNTTTDRPWRNYLCCMVAANREFAETNPIAAKRALRAILKANRLCSEQPDLAAQWLVESGQSPTVDFAMRTLRDLPYEAWSDYVPEDSLRFYALRLREAGIIDTTPEFIIEKGSDWRMFDQLKQELKT